MKILLLIVLFIYQISTRKLVFVQNLFRHGARYPIFLNNDDFTNQSHIAQNAGQLSPQGKNMHYMLGKVLYKKYWTALFGGTDAHDKLDNKQIYVKSTNVNRTIQSVESQLRGLLENLTPLSLEPIMANFALPAFQNLTDYLNISYTQSQWKVFNQMPKYQSVPLHTSQGSEEVSSTNPYDEGDFLLKFDKLNCPQQQQWMAKNYNSQTAQQIMNLPQVKQALSKLQQAYPSQTVTFQNAYRYIDNFICMQFLGQPTLQLFSNPKYEKTLRYLKEVSMFISLFYQPIQYQTTATNLFETMVYNFKAAISGTGPKLILYSAHDTTVGMVLATFNLTNVACINDKYLKDLPNQETCASDYPRFAANFIIQVYKEDNGTYTFDIVFNNIQRRIPFCDYQFSCPVEKFYQWVDGWKIDDPNKQCGVKDQFEVKLETMKKRVLNSYVGIAVLVLVVLVQLIWIIGTCVKQNKEKKRKQGYMENFQEKEIGNHPHPQLPLIDIKQ